MKLLWILWYWKSIQSANVSTQNRTSINLNREAQPHNGDWIHPGGHHWPPWAAGPIVWTVPPHLSDLSDWQLGHDHLYHGEFQAENTHVLLSKTPRYYCPWLFNSRGTKNVTKFSCRSKYSCLSLVCSLLVKFIFCLQCPMTTMWLSVSLCSIWSSCQKDYAGCL